MLVPLTMPLDYITKYLPNLKNSKQVYGMSISKFKHC